MNRIACAIIAVIIIAFAIVFDACIIASYSPTILHNVECVIWLVIIWDMGLQG